MLIDALFASFSFKGRRGLLFQSFLHADTPPLRLIFLLTLVQMRVYKVQQNLNT